MKFSYLFFFLFVCPVFASSDFEDFQDLNGDGRQDIFYEYEDDGYFELIDTNFDGRVDVSFRYSNQDEIVSSKSDENFDGILETTSIYKDGSIFRSWVDLNNDGYGNIFYFFNYGVLTSSERFYKKSKGDEIGKIKYRFGYPSEEVIEKTFLSPQEFHEQRVIN